MCCRVYPPPPLTGEHPAYPEEAAPVLPPSQTLAYGPADIPSLQPAAAMPQLGLMAQHTGHGTHGTAQPGQRTVVGEGKVIAVVPSSSQVVVDHKDIPGVMGAMTMGYRVEPSSLLERVQAGDTIRFIMDPQQQVIVAIEKLHE
jgi:Cu/Ag efflux protein CusF